MTLEHWGFFQYSRVVTLSTHFHIQIDSIWMDQCTLASFWPGSDMTQRLPSFGELMLPGTNYFIDTEHRRKHQSDIGVCGFLVVCLGSLSCCEVNHLPVFSHLVAAGFHQEWPVTTWPIPAKEKQPHNIMLPQPCFTIITAPGWCAVFGFCQTLRFFKLTKKLNLYHKTFCLWHQNLQCIIIIWK